MLWSATTRAKVNGSRRRRAAIANLQMQEYGLTILGGRHDTRPGRSLSTNACAGGVSVPRRRGWYAARGVLSTVAA
jgi:hypothetical protein